MRLRLTFDAILQLLWSDRSRADQQIAELQRSRAPGARGVETLLKGKQSGELGFAEPTLAHEHLSQSFFRRLLFGEGASELRSRQSAGLEQQFADRFSRPGCGIQYIVQARPLRANPLDRLPLFWTQLLAVEHAVDHLGHRRLAIERSTLVLIRCAAHSV
ncbi:MAG TPA: hypothetical protein VGP14_11935 [Casimicrobiaceae bacterium]|nr:hypothetical protein [Casimicrobiaceae bacterium]